MKPVLVKIGTFVVPNSITESFRLCDLTPGTFPTIPSKKAMKNSLKKGLIRVNNKRGYSGSFINSGDTIDLFQDTTQTAKKVSIDLKLDVLFEDDFLAIIYKPAGIEVSGNKKWTIKNALESNLKKSSEKDAVAPLPIHRLDYPTSGLLLIGKTASTILELNSLFEKRQVQKEYLAITIGKMEENGILKTPVENKESEASYELISSVASPRFDFLNLIKLNPKTGRKHQLRVQLSEHGNPILGDLLYGKEDLLLKGKGLYLHAFSLKFTHPKTGELLSITSEVPKKYKKLFPEITLK
ncbi:RluA family pseudouridine synthase [Aureivirga sp. CE67]|uniref:RluA family pseudouridine synthase n=1 Tax=Aureivirga sp. CE67 TaxID=1788983 RepID=UPI001E2DAC4F|nr:RluA family pseudouridine synthase [Aureivirga sp. CE67]